MKPLSKRLEKLGDDWVAGSHEILINTVLAVDTTLVLATPVDTGRARSNWQVALDGPAEGTIDEPMDIGTIQAAAANVVSRHKPGDGQINITNNLPYIGRLNKGWSAQAPAGFVEQAILAASEIINKSKVFK